MRTVATMEERGYPRDGFLFRTIKKLQSNQLPEFFAMMAIALLSIHCTLTPIYQR